jgi:hypothetical protein
MVSALELLPAIDPTFRRLAVMSAQSAGDTVTLSGVTETGLVLVSSISADRFAQIPHSKYVEIGWSW